PHTFTTSHPHIYTTSLHDALPISYFCERQHRLHLGAITILQGRKAQLASIPHKDKAAGDGNNVLGFLADFQVSHAVCIACGLTFCKHLVLATKVAQRSGALYANGISLNAVVYQTGAVLAADPQLLGNVWGLGIFLLLAHAHKVSRSTTPTLNMNQAGVSDRTRAIFCEKKIIHSNVILNYSLGQLK